MYVVGCRWRSVRAFLVVALALGLAVFPPALRAAPDDPFTGAWTGTGGPGSKLRLNVGGANPSGVRQVIFSVQGGEGGLGVEVACKAHGEGTVSLSPSSTAFLLEGTWELYHCDGGAINPAGFSFLTPLASEIIFSGADHLFRVGRG